MIWKRDWKRYTGATTFIEEFLNFLNNEKQQITCFW